MAKRRVVYTGETRSYYSCDEPTALIPGKMYEVICVEDHGFHSNYRLSGIKGRFNSVWFQEVPVYLAQSTSLPYVGKALQNFIRFENSGVCRRVISSSTVTSIHKMYDNVYEVVTRNSVYILQYLPVK